MMTCSMPPCVHAPAFTRMKLCWLCSLCTTTSSTTTRRIHLLCAESTHIIDSLMVTQLFATFDKEWEVEDVQVVGRLPDWLSGALLRTGPAKFEVGERKLQHWFDGLAMLYRFSLHAGSTTENSTTPSGSTTRRRVSFSCKFLQSEQYKQSTASNRVVFPEFGTFPDPDPCRTIFRRMKSQFSSHTSLSDNGSVNVLKVGDKMFAITETPNMVEFDPVSLETKGGFSVMPQGLNGQTNTAHPHLARDGSITFNFTTEIGHQSYYHVYSFPTNAFPPVYTRICSIPVSEPGYIHSFGNSQKYIILVEYPIVANPVNFLVGQQLSRPFIGNYEWRSNGKTKFFIVDKENHTLVGTWKAPPCFCFHHINAFEISATKIEVDMAVYDDASIVTSFFMDILKDNSTFAKKPTCEVRRYTIDLEASQDVELGHAVLFPEHFELPRINHASTTLPYRYAYALGSVDKANFWHVIHKLDVESRTCITWSKEGVFPSEPVFVARPGGDTEDDGVVLSVVISPLTSETTLLVLDAKTLQEIAHASVGHPLPMMLHGNFFAGEYCTL